MNILEKKFLKTLADFWQISAGAGACAGFLKGVGEKLARSASSEVATSEAICSNGSGRNPRKKF